ncbi:AAA family ATPase [Seohaeicola saemankumensis]|nr:adenylate/guanylate cyclase domain-containing protein [Seohaeicola saemankumensis]MCA0873991.1 AAA family ATPase [Seohaeicola saemankumensis]
MSEELSNWLSELGLGQYTADFLKNNVDLSILSDLTGEDLKEIGVEAVGDRRRLLRAIEGLDVLEETAPEEAMAPLDSTKRQVTVMFVDLSGFTSLSSGLDAEDTHALLNSFFAKADTIVERFGGRIDKHIGDAVMAVFGAPVSHTNDSERATRAALEVHAALATLDPPLTCHVGIASGQVIASNTGSEAHTEYTITGDGVNLASRLTEIASPGETLISHEIQRALGALFVGDSLGLKSIKGLVEPIEIWRLARLARNMRTRRHRFIGRERELSLLDAAFDRCRRHGKGEVHVLLGEPGIGKTHLTEEAQDLAVSKSFSGHGGVVMDFGTREGQSAVQSVVRSLLDLGGSAISDTARQNSVVGQAVANGLISPANRAHLSALLEIEQEPGVAEVYATMDNATRIRGRRSVVEELIRARCEMGPVLIQIEDIHWAPPEILSACAHIAASAKNLPCILMMTSRVDGDPIDLQWQAATEGAFLTKLELSALSDDQARELMRAVTEVDPATLERFIARAGGNPLFLEQLLRNQDAMRHDDIPGSIQVVVQSRLDTVDAATRKAIQAASVLGQRFAPDALKFLLQDDGFDLSRLYRSAMVRENGSEMIFAHALIRDGSYETLFKSERAMLHERAAKWYVDRDSTLRAQHLDRAGSPEAAGAYLDAIKKLIQSYQFHEVEPLLNRALELPCSASDRFDLLCARSETARLQGQSEKALADFAEAATFAETDGQIFRAHIGLAQTARQASLYQDALDSLEIAETAARRKGSDHDLAQINYVRGNIYFPLGRFSEAQECNELALTLARKLGSVRLEVGALSGFGDANFMNGTMQTAVSYYTQAVERARPNGLVRDLAANLHNRSVSRSYCGDVEQGRADAHESIDVSQRYFAFVPECVAQTCLGVAQTLLGEIDGALVSFRKSAEIGGRVGAKRLEAQGLEHLARTLVYSGLLREAETTGREAVEIALEHGRNFVGPKALSALALALADPAEQDQLLKQGEEIIGEGCVGHSLLHFYSDACAIMLSRGDWAGALRFAGDLERFTAQEPLPLIDLTIREVRHLAACGDTGQSPNTGNGFQAIEREFRDMGIKRSLLGGDVFS